MKIAIAQNGDLVSGHFGSSEGYAIYTIAGTDVTHEEDLKNPGHDHTLQMTLLASKGVTQLIAGGMGKHAQEIFTQNGITVLLGAQGPVQEVIQSFASGKLPSGSGESAQCSCPGNAAPVSPGTCRCSCHHNQ
ncbi:MAG: NifB/NifX family molybdenum-iron cluster-binding protein [Methanobacteriota archaeon]